LARPQDSFRVQDGRFVGKRTGEPLPFRLVLFGREVDGRTPVHPEMRGYRPHQVEVELWAEAIRAYIADPNSIKTVAPVAPDVANAIRVAVNNNPKLKDVIQFNAMAPVAGAGAMAGLLGSNGESNRGGSAADGSGRDRQSTQRTLLSRP